VFLRALAAFLILPGMVAFAVPWLIAHYDPWLAYASNGGLVLLLIGVLVLFWCIRDFYVAGKGTLAPWEPPQQLVDVGLYKFSRNPMYIAVLIIIAGWAAYTGSHFVLVYGFAWAIIFHRRVVVYEEPWLENTFGADWQRYQRLVPRWLPLASRK
jgi:protein-S-isoprenylcysteine O-methyltransferase Ste14